MSLPIITYGLVAVLGYILYRQSRKPSHPYPPGPNGLPVLGNALQMPTEREWITFAKWRKDFGDVVHLSVLGRHLIVLNSAKAVNDLFDKRSALYSDRPTLPMAGEMVGYVESVPLCHYNDRHRELRKLMFETLAPRKAQELYPVHIEKTRIFLDDLLKSPDQFLSHIRLTIARIVFQISHGYTVHDEHDKLMVLAERANEEFSVATAPGAFLVDVFPVLQYVPDWLPGAGFKRKAKAWRNTMENLRDNPYDWVKDQLKAGVAQPSFTTSLVERFPSPSPEQESIIKWASGSFYSAGADTTVSAISAFFLAMSLYPEVQRKAQEEIDAVVGSSRLPTFEDRAKLPYFDAILKEVYRWNPVANLALPHVSSQDDVYEGYLIPSGSIMFANTWGILHDPDVYTSPLEFLPERYLAADGKSPSALPDSRAFAFGYGRRVCPGQHLADASLYIITLNTIAAFNIAPVTDKTGAPAKPAVQFSPGLISHPDAFAAQITPRSPAHARLVQESCEHI